MAQWFVVMTLMQPHSRGFMNGTKRTVMTVPPGTTREEIYVYMRGLFPPEFNETANVLFFSAEPNEIGDAS